MNPKCRVRLVCAFSILLTTSHTLAQQAVETPATAPASQPAASQPQPRLEVSPTEFDFGEVWEGAPAKGEFMVKNVGDAPLTVSLKSTCGCTVVTDPKSPLLPGESTTFTITYATTRIGKANKMVRVMTNDPDHKQMRIPVQGHVKQLFEMSPGRTIAFNRLEDSDRRTRKILIENRYETPLKLRLVEDRKVDLSQLKIDLTEIEAGQKYELTVSTNPPLKFGLNRVNVLLQTDREDLPQIKIPVSTTVQPRVAISPVRVFVPRKKAPPRKVTFRITFKKGRDIRLTGVMLGDRRLEHEELPGVVTAANSDSDMKRFWVMLPASDEITPDHATMKILTAGDPDFAELEVAVIRRGARTQSGRNDAHAGARRTSSQPTSQPAGAAPGHQTP